MARVIHARSRVIGAGLADAKAEAEATLNAARAEAEAIRTRAVNDAIEAREAARVAGREQAHAEAGATMLAAARAKDAMLAHAERDVVEIALLAAGKIVEAHVAVGPSEVLALVKSTLDRARRAKTVVLTLHPEDAATLSNLGDEGLPPNVHVEADPSLSRGDCVARSELGAIDARVRTKLEAVRAALIGPR
jgi:type III secretion protein L